jgi:hypothetical protein
MIETINQVCEVCECDLWENLATGKKNYVIILDKYYCKDCSNEHASFLDKLSHSLESS